MSALRRLLVRLRGLVRPRSAEAELDEELRYHLERDIARRVAAGAPPDEARAAARRQFGNPTLIAEEARQSWQVQWVERFVQDVRYALRSFARAPGFVATVVLTIGLGLGLLTSAFTIFNTYILQPNDVRDPWGLYELWFQDRQMSGRNFAWSEYKAMRESNPSFSDVFAYRWLVSRLDGEPLVLQGVSGNFFSGLGVTPAAGRVLLPSDDEAPGSEPVLVLSHQAWRSRFASDSSVVGRVAHVNGRAMRIVGVARVGFDGLVGVPPDFWIPITAIGGLSEDGIDPFGPKQPEVFRIIGRLRPGVTPSGASRALAAWGAARTADRPEAQRVATARLASRATPAPMGPEMAQLVVPIAVAFVLVLLIACANVANVMLARGMARQREFGVRLALGAARARLVRQLLTESVLLALPAAGVAFALSRLTIGAGVWAMFASLPPGFALYVRVLPLVPDERVFAFLVLAALVSAFAFGLAPALQATRPRVVEATRGDFDSSFRPSRLRGALVAAQVTIAVLLLICAGVLLRGAQHVGARDSGMRTAGLLELDIVDKSRATVLAELRTLPEVTDFAASAHAALDGGRFPTIAASGKPGSRTVVAFVNAVTPNFFELVGAPLRQGRGFSVDEGRRHAPVVVVSEEAARQFWPGGGAVGATLELATTDSTPPRSVQVIGVVKNTVPGVMYLGADVPIVFEPAPAEDPDMSLMLRVPGDAERARVRVEAALEGRVPGSVAEFHTADEAVALQVYPFRAGHWLATVIAVVALLLTATGIYGVVSYVVVQRTKEIGIRLALGAGTTQVILLVGRELLRLAAGGVAAGTLLSLGVSRLFASQIIAFDTFDGLAYIGGIVVAVVACAAAAFVPSRRVAAVDPVIALRSE